MKTLQALTPNVPLRDRLALFAKDTRERAASLPPGDELLRKAHRADTVSADWANSLLKFFG